MTRAFLGKQFVSGLGFSRLDPFDVDIEVAWNKALVVALDRSRAHCLSQAQDFKDETPFDSLDSALKISGLESADPLGAHESEMSALKEEVAKILGAPGAYEFEAPTQEFTYLIEVPEEDPVLGYDVSKAKAAWEKEAFPDQGGWKTLDRFNKARKALGQPMLHVRAIRAANLTKGHLNYIIKQMPKETEEIVN
jgi:hypothetical protein